MKQQLSKVRNALLVIVSPWMMLALSPPADASVAYGTLGNFDCVNDVVVNNNPVECHGFEIELEDIHSTDISYTYDYNHYGVPNIREDNSDPAHPRVYIRWAAKKNPDGSWSAFTAIPAGPITPTDGHQFTNPSVNFGGEHFGVGYNRAPTAVRNFWLIDDGAGNLMHGPPVNIAMPTFTYYPAVAQVQPVIVPPPPPAPPVFRFGDATWVKDIKTTTHNPNKVELTDLVDPDPDNPDAHDWTNGEPAEVETEWRLLQTEFAQPDDPDPANPNGELAGMPEELPDGNEVITRRYEFYKYIGPIDAESGEAMADQVGERAPDGMHYYGLGTVTYNDHFDPVTGEWVEVTVDLSTIEVVGDFFGAQMAGFDVAPALGLIDHIPDGELNVPYADRTVVVAAGAAFLASVSGTLPEGTTLDVLTGIFSGTPTAAGVFTFTVEASNTGGAYVSKEYTVTIPEGLPLTSMIITSASPPAGGTTTGDGVYNNGTPVLVVATHNPGYAFVNWTENGVEVSLSANYPFTVSTDRTLVANFVQTYAVATSASPSAGGTTSGDGVFNSGTGVTVLANANPGYAFGNWTENGGEVSTSAGYNFTLTADRILVANFILVGCVVDADCADEDACTADLCLTNVCEHQPIAGCCNTNEQCEDGDVCTRDACTNHVCTFENIPTCCSADAQCADANDCTLDACVNFECQHATVPGCCLTDGECNDTDVCTTDVCINLVCDHQPVAGCCNTEPECDDSNGCTRDLCVDHACTHEDIPACCNTDAECDDGDSCTIDRCEDLVCTHGSVADCCRTDADCDDGDACTQDACDGALNRCVHTVADADGDGICDEVDACPHSLMGATIVIGKCDSGVANQMRSGGCTMSDQIAACDDARGIFARCVAVIANEWQSAGLISGRERGRIQACAGRSTVSSDKLQP